MAFQALWLSEKCCRRKKSNHFSKIQRFSELAQILSDKGGSREFDFLGQEEYPGELFTYFDRD